MKELDFLIVLYATLGLIQLLFYRYFRLHFPKVQERKFNQQLQAASLIIAFKNEQINLKKLLPKILEQDYPAFEIILINDHSTDDSVQLIKRLNDHRIRLLDLENGQGKKAAIELGIISSKNELLLFTDADCCPASDQWMKRMLLPLNQSKEISLGYAPFYKKWGLLNAIQRYENFMNYLQNFSYAQINKAYMGVGRNLAYKRSVYIHSNSFEQYKALQGGDDDLIVNEMSKKGNTATVIHPASFCLSEAVSDWKSYFFQKRRHLEVGRFYRLKDRLKLAMVGLSQLFFNLLFIILCIWGDALPFILGIFVVKAAVQLLFYATPLKRLEEFDLWIYIPFLEMIYLPIISWIGLSQYLWKVERWK